MKGTLVNAQSARKIRGCIALLMAFMFLGSVGCANSQEAPTSADTGVKNTPETVLKPGDRLTIKGPEGIMEVKAFDNFGRCFTWEGGTRCVTMLPRTERWYGSLGVYWPGPGDHWKNHHGITRGVIQEGRQNFANEEEAIRWIREQTWISLFYTKRGIVAGWSKTPARSQLNVDVWQILIDGKVPESFPGGSDANISIESF